MLTSVDILPAGTIGFVAHGRVTDADCRRILEPTIVWARELGPVRLLYEIGTDFSGYESGGLFDDTIFGTRHFADFDRIAFVADDGVWRRAVDAIVGLMPADLRLFETRDEAAARLWLAGSAPMEPSMPSKRRNHGNWLDAPPLLAPAT